MKFGAYEKSPPLPNIVRFVLGCIDADFKITAFVFTLSAFVEIYEIRTSSFQKRYAVDYAPCILFPISADERCKRDRKKMLNFQRESSEVLLWAKVIFFFSNTDFT